MAGLCAHHQASQAERWANAGRLDKTIDFSTTQTPGWKEWQDAVGRMPAGGPYDYRPMAEAVVDDLLGDEDVAGVAQSAMNTPYAEAERAYREHFAKNHDGPEAWNHAFYEMGIWAPGESNQYRVQQLGYDLDRFLKEFRQKFKPKDLDDYVDYWLRDRVNDLLRHERREEGIIQLWRTLALE